MTIKQTPVTEATALVLTPEQRHERDLASYAQEQDLYKHLATLSTGSIVLLATFLDRLFAHPVAKGLVIAALIGFACSILGTVTMQLFSVLHVNAEPNANLPTRPSVATVLIVLAGFGGFVVGVVSLTVFAVLNLVGR